MVEVIKHTLGFCGEHWHPNLWTYNLASEKRKSLRTKINRLDHKVKVGKKTTKKQSENRSGKNLKLDEAFYEESFNQSNHKCEECGIQLPTEFRNDDGKINARWRYSHIVAKSIREKVFFINDFWKKFHNN